MTKRMTFFMVLVYVVALAWALFMGWLWVYLDHWPAWYIYPAAVMVWLCMVIHGILVFKGKL